METDGLGSEFNHTAIILQKKLNSSAIIVLGDPLVIIILLKYVPENSKYCKIQTQVPEPETIKNYAPTTTIPGVHSVHRSSI